MATPKCPSCSGYLFERVEIQVEKASFQTFAICCYRCGAIFGIQEEHNIGALIHKLSEKLKIKL